MDKRKKAMSLGATWFPLKNGNGIIEIVYNKLRNSLLWVQSAHDNSSNSPCMLTRNIGIVQLENTSDNLIVRCTSTDNTVCSSQDPTKYKGNYIKILYILKLSTVIMATIMKHIITKQTKHKKDLTYFGARMDPPQMWLLVREFISLRILSIHHSEEG